MEILEKLIDEDHFFWLMMGSIAIIAIVFGSVASMVKSANREKTRREIAAYIASGSMTAEQGERLLKDPPDEA